nr:hypothetical protein [Amycolatopsis vastitatis]
MLIPTSPIRAGSANPEVPTARSTVRTSAISPVMVTSKKSPSLSPWPERSTRTQAMPWASSSRDIRTKSGSSSRFEPKPWTNTTVGNRSPLSGMCSVDRSVRSW